MWNQVRIYRKLQCPVEAHKLVKKTDCSHSPIVCIMMHCWNEAHIAILGFFLRGGSNGCNIKSEFTANSKKNPFHSNPPPKKNGAHQTLFVKAETASTRRSTASLHTRHQKFRPHHPSNKKGKLHSFFWQLNNSPPRLFIVSMSRQSGMLAASLLLSLLHPIPIPTDDIFIVCENAILFRKTP
jgi:hypothetical protein